MIEHAKWIKTPEDIGSISPRFSRKILLNDIVKKATVKVSSMGVYDLYVNGKKAENVVLAPGFTSYPNRILYQNYDITELLDDKENVVDIICGKGWAIGCFGNSKKAVSGY